jgi:hypothetical protein
LHYGKQLQLLNEKDFDKARINKENIAKARLMKYLKK